MTIKDDLEKRREEFREYYRDYGFEGERLEQKVDQVIAWILGQGGDPGSLAPRNQFDSTKKFWTISKLYFNAWQRDQLKYSPPDFDRKDFNRRVVEFQQYYDSAMRAYKKEKLKRWRAKYPGKYRAIQRRAEKKYRAKRVSKP